ncbi:MAG: T9SS type A sorting domain-containing protein [Microscillaceae bacterium]|nr:T9SS type A sorting domain-containing protein [Microscillaceae bacterium]
MRKILLFLGILLMGQGLVSAQTIITQWNFNSETPDANTGTGNLSPSTGAGTASLVGGTTATFASGDAGNGSSDPATGDDSGWNISTFPAAATGSETAGIQFLVSTAGRSNIVFTFDQRHSNTSSRFVRVQYTLDGTNWTNFTATGSGTQDGLFVASMGDNWFNARTCDFSSITGANNNPNFGLRILSAFAPGTSDYVAAGNTSTYGTGGTWRFDMITIQEGAPAPVTPLVNLAVQVNGGNVLTASEADASVLNLVLTASTAVTGNQTVELVLSGLGLTAADYTLEGANTTLTILDGQTSGSKTLTIVNDTDNEGSEIINVRIQNPSAGILLGGTTSRDIFVFDNDAPAPPVANNEISLTLLGSYQNGVVTDFEEPENSSEISAYDPVSKRLFTVNSIAGQLDIIDMADPADLSPINSIDITVYGGGINSVAVRNGLVAVALEAEVPQDNGKVVFFNADGTFQKEVNVGALPDMISFSPNGNLVLTANEGEPSGDYTNDPEGSVSIIDISGGIANLTQANVTTAGFTAFNAQATTLREAGVRIYGPNATVAQDLEPEFITFNADGSKAYITLQENNAVAVLDIASKTITGIEPLGYKDHSQLGNGLDANDQGGEAHISSRIQIANYPVFGMYQPDAIASFSVGGNQYLITANEGDAREYEDNADPNLQLVEEVRIGNAAFPLDLTAFPNASFLKLNNVMGRLNATNRLGDTDNDGDFDEIYVLGGRSFSIWQVDNNQNVSLTYDSGEQLERITARDVPAIFNASNTGISIDNRSDNKGPEPEGVTTATIGNQIYAFVSLERVGGVLVYNVTTPAAPVFVQYINPRSTTALEGDLGAEGIFFIPATEAPTGQALLVVSNEISSTISVFALNPVPGEFTIASLVNEINPLRNVITWNASSGALQYDVQRRTVGGDFEVIASNLNTTSYSDASAAAGTSYEYQIIARNNLGQRLSNVSSAILTRAEDAFAQGIALYPNPSDGTVQINLNLPFVAQAEYKLLDASGKSLKAWVQSTAPSRMDFQFLPAGTYFLQVKTEGRLATKRLVIE